MTQTIKTNIKFLDKMTRKRGILAGSTIIIIYDSINHGTKLLENLATVGHKTRFLTSSRKTQTTKNSMSRIVPEKQIKENTQIQTSQIQNYPQAISKQTNQLKNENMVIEDFERLLQITNGPELVEQFKKIRQKIEKTQTLLFIGIKKSSLEKHEPLQTITATADGVIEMRTQEESGETQNLLTVRRLPKERDLPQTTGVPAADKIEKSGTQDIN